MATATDALASVRVKLDLPRHILDAYEREAEELGVTLDEVLISRLIDCVSFTSIKKETLRNQAVKTNYDKRYLEKNFEKVNFVKKQLLLGNLKVEEFKTNKILRCKREYERKIDEEKTYTKKSEFDIMEMEKMELELIRKLQQSQYIQKTVYEELEGALTLPLLEYEHKYKVKNLTEEADKKKKKKTKKKMENSLKSLKIKVKDFKF